MPDLDFNFTQPNIHTDWSSITARSAVLGPLAWRRSITVPDAYTALQQQWRDLAVVLVDAAWNVISDSREEPDDDTYTRAIGYLRNCPPFGVRKTATSRTCQRWRVCPFCYGREVMDTFRAVEFACRMLEPPLLEKVKLLAFRQQKSNLREAASDWNPNGDKNNSWHTAASCSLWITHNLFKKSDVLGSCVRFTYQPGETPGLMTATRSTLLLVLVGARVPDGLIDCCREVSPITRKAISEIVAWCFRYPVGMMRGDAATAVKILNGLSGKTSAFSAMTGLFKNRPFRDLVYSLRA